MQPTSSKNLPESTPGRCRYCRCTQMCACPDGCAWYDVECTVCDTRACVLKFRRALANLAKKLLRVDATKAGRNKAKACHIEAAEAVATLCRELDREVKSHEAEEKNSVR